MTERDRLNAVLEKLGKGAPLSVPDSASVQDVLTGLLRAIDETVLPRDLVVSAGDEILKLHVAKRRLLEVSGVIESELSESRPEELTELGTKIAQKLVGQAITFESVRPELSPDPSAIGASVNALAAAWAQASLGDSGLSDLADRGRASIVWIDGQEVSRTGRKSTAEKLEIDREALRTLNGKARGAISFTAQGATEGAIFLWNNEEEAVVVFPVDELPIVLADWLSL